MLTLFDIDHTLLSTRGLGQQAMEMAAQQLYRDDATLEGVEIAGRLDPLIWADLAAKYEIEAGVGAHQIFRDTYTRLFAALVASGAQIDVMPGVPDLLDALASHKDITLGLLTGNYPESGEVKIRNAGLDFSLFQLAAWGSDGSHRRDLPRVATSRYERLMGSPIAAERIVIIGDTPHDVDCAKHNGCLVIGVATGYFDTGTLAAHGADLAVDDLSDTANVLDWLSTQPSPCRAE